MGSKPLAAALVVLALVWHSLARADEAATVDAVEMRELADYASRATNSPKLTELPVITRRPDPTLFVGCSCKPVALFIAGTLYVDPAVDLATDWGRGNVLHELTHAVQAQRRGVSYDCAEWNRRETEAINVQNAWLAGKTGKRAMFIAGRCNFRERENHESHS